MVPVDEAIQITCDLVYDSPNPPLQFGQRTFKKLLSMAAKNTLFLFDGTYYTQTNGVSMGNPLAPSLAEVYLQNLEKQFFKCSIEPIFFKRYVDDCFAVFENSKVSNDFFQFLNSLNVRIIFTKENYKNCLHFLDTTITKSNNNFLVDWYRKTAASDRITPYTSYCHQSYIYNVVYNMFSRVDRICSEDKKIEARHRVFSLLQKNGYPNDLIDKIQNEVSNKVCKNTTNDNDTTIYMPIPYFGSDNIFEKRIKSTIKYFTGINLRLAFSSSKISDFFQIKDKIPNAIQSRVVYKFCCDCGQSYIGETFRHLTTRVGEHYKAKNSNIFNHLKSSQMCHQNTKEKFIESFKILHKCKLKFDTKIAEAILIRQHEPTLNDYVSAYKLSLW